MKKRLYILAPNDRYNYGDLLFPYVLTHYFKSSFDDIVYVSTTKSDLSAKGGIPTVSYSALFNVDSDNWENHLIVAGGESLCIGWMTILSYVDKRVELLKKIAWKLKKMVGTVSLDVMNAVVGRLFHTKTRFVFSVGKNELPQFKTIVYNALGGSHPSIYRQLKTKKIQAILSSVDLITVRDDDTGKALENAHIKHSVSPDSAILMSEVFSEDMLLEKITVPKEPYLGKHYIFFQGNLQTWRSQYEVAARQLDDLYEKTHCRICLCPIGTALGHCDDIALANIVGQVKNKEAFAFVENPNVFDVMWLIKHSQMYIGSSLHGVITAMSFNVPYVGYGGRKQIAYIEKWSGGRMRTASCHDFVDAALHNINVSEKSDAQKTLVKRTFNEFSKLYK